MSRPAEVPAGYVVDVWQVTRLISRGAWGSVYAATPVAEAAAGGERVALKFLLVSRLSRGQSDLMAEIARREADFSKHTDHPYLIRTLAVHTLSDPGDPSLDGAVVLVMELAAASLKQLLEAARPGLPVAGGAGMLAQACEALAHMHARGWVHGDLKPGNVLVMNDGSVRIADFGLTAQVDGTHAYTPQIGSPDYLPPEWWTERAGEQGIAVRATADIWAFGVLAHQVLAGGLHPFPGATSQARLLAAHAYAAGTAPLRLDERIPPPWRALIADCLAPGHERRAAHGAVTLLNRIRGLPYAKSGATPRRRRLLATPLVPPSAGPARAGTTPGRATRAGRRRLVIAPTAALILAVTVTLGGIAPAEGVRRPGLARQAALAARTPLPPLSAASLAGGWQGNYTVTSASGYFSGWSAGATSDNFSSFSAGDTIDGAWRFIPGCGIGPCPETAYGRIGNSPFTMTLERAGAGYTGSAVINYQGCVGSDGQEYAETNHLSLRVTPATAAPTGREWLATSWNGALTLTASPAACAAGTLTARLSSASPATRFPGAAPTVTSVSPATASAGQLVTVRGSGFGAYQGRSRVFLTDNGMGWGLPGNQATFQVESWSDDAITFTVPRPSGPEGAFHVWPRTAAALAVTTSDGGVSNGASLTIG